MTRIPVKRLVVNMGLNPQGQIMGAPHFASAMKSLFVVPGRYAIIETINASGTKTIAELPIGPFGIEYDPIDAVN